MAYGGGRKGDCSWMAAPHLDGLKEHGVKILHVIRNPLPTIRSLLGIQNFWSYEDGEFGNNWAKYKAHYCKMTEEELGESVGASMLYWLRWNEMIEDKEDFRWKLEDDSIMVISEALEVLGEKRTMIEIEKAMREAYKQPNHHVRQNDIDIRDLKLRPSWMRLKDTAARFGYEL